MKLVEENFDFEFRKIQHKGNPARIPTFAKLDLVNLAREILDTTRAGEEAAELRRLGRKTSMTSMEEPKVSTSAPGGSPTSRFTAVNGKEPATGGGNVVSRRGSVERPISNGLPLVTTSGQEKLTITTTTSQREDWTVPVNKNQPYPPVTYSSEAGHKRRRSGSVEHNSSSANSYHTHALPSSNKETPTTASTEPDLTRQELLRGQPQHHSAVEVRDPYGSDADYRRYLAAAEENRQMAHGHDPWARQYPTQHLNSDEHLGEVLQRASHNMDHRHEYEQDSPGDADRSANPYSAYGHDRREMSASSDPKRRKRNFSNRTKTGCMTCRKRKKKCDETRPECNNCMRGGFICAGYQQRNHWTKPEQKQPPVQLQAKTDFENATFNSYNPNMGPRRELPGYRGQTLRVEPPHGRSIGIDDEQPSASTMPSASVTSPDNSRLSAISYAQQLPTPLTASSSAYPDRQPKNAYERLGPLHDLTRQESRLDSDSGTPQSASTTLPQILHPQLHGESPLATSQPAANQAPSELSARSLSQKELMLSGQYYFPFDKELVLERERCNGACWRFNNSTNPNNGVSPEERSRLFRDILQPRESATSPTQTSQAVPIGRVGENVVVEAPFNCDYGYNISIGQDVVIGKNCTILDTCDVIIGDRCIIGPNVNIYTTNLSTNPKKRMGSRGPNRGKKVVIEKDCFIGGNVTILAGMTIHAGSTVGAGSVVTRDVPPGVVSCGNPSRTKRGIYTLGNDD